MAESVFCLGYYFSWIKGIRQNHGKGRIIYKEYEKL